MSGRKVTPGTALLLFLAATSCADEATDAPTETRRAAVTSPSGSSPDLVGVSPPGPGGRRLVEPLTPNAQGKGSPVPPPRDRPASEHPGHFANKVVAKPARVASETAAPSAIPAAYRAKQDEYLRQWAALQPTLAGVPPEEQDARRAELKKSVLGD